jgi:3,4-dihydroxy 2-butanone 4-phosphate synthase/GTP cyclohydrolase II
VVLRQQDATGALLQSLRAARQPLDAGDAAAEGGTILRTHGIGAQILRDLGVRRMRVLSAPRQLRGIAAFGLEITGYED